MPFASGKSISRILGLTSAATLATVITGCGIGTQSAPVVTGNASGSISGIIHGGNQPVTGADVRLYAAGTTGYGSAPTLYAVTTSANDSSFSFTKTAGAGTTSTKVYGCPTNGTDPQMYITAKGGSTQGPGSTSNTDAGFIIAIGKCSAIGPGTSVDMTETTTVATLAALQQFFSPANATVDGLNHLGMPSSAQAVTAFANGVATIANLVNVATGVVPTSSTISATPTGSTAAISVTVTPEVSKINTIANVIAACVNNASSGAPNCTTLYTGATPPNSAVTSQPAINFGTATDTLQAAYYMLVNPTNGSVSNLKSLFGLSSPTAPFQPSLAVAPTDWTVGIRYSSAGTCTAGTFLTGPYVLASDATGNIWIAGGSTAGNLMEVTSNGTPANCSLGANVASAKGLTIDTSGNVWIAGSAANSSYYKYNIAGSTSTVWPLAVATSVPNGVAADGSGNIFFTDSANSSVYDFSAGASTTTPAAPTLVGSSIGSTPLFIAADTAGRIFVTQSTTTGLLYDIYPSTATGNVGGYITASIGSTTSVTNPYALAAGISGQIYVGNSANSGSTVAQTTYYFTPSTTSAGTATFSSNSAQYAAGIGSPRGPAAVDGAGNIWYANSLASTGNYVTATTTPIGYSVTEISAVNSAMSPSSTITTGNNAGFQKDSTIFSASLRSVAIDPTGNVWVGLNSTTGNGIAEIVGAAVPVVTPIAAGLAAGTITTNAVQKP